MEGPAHDPFLYPPPSRPATGGTSHGGAGCENRWGPYHNAGDFSANMALVLLILVCTLAFVLAFTATVRFFLRRDRRRRSPSADLEKQERAGRSGAAPEPPAAVAFAPGMKLAGSAAECAICLAEFAEGEGVRVLPACNHGFHVKCVEAWLASKSSCPTCRCSCQVAAAGPPEKSQPSPSPSPSPSQGAVISIASD